MRLKNYGRGLCSCCGGTHNPLYGNREAEGGSVYIRGGHPQRRYCAPCWNTIGVAPTSDVPWADDRPDDGGALVSRGWARLVEGT